MSLYLWARPNLTPEQAATVLAGLSPQANQVSSWTYEKMLSVQARMNQAGMPIDSNHALTLAWLENRDVRTLENVDELGWLFAQVQLMDRTETGAQEFTVRWSGSIQAPASGQYTLSVCPFDLNFRSGNTFRQQTTKIWIANEQVLDSTQDGWTFQSRPVSLSAGQSTAIRIEFSFTCWPAGVMDARPAVAMLYWEGPGMNKQLVPTAALVPPSGNQEEHGLQGEYLLTVTGQENAVTRLDPEINFIWYHQCFVVSAYNDLRSRLAEQLYAVAGEVSTLARWENEAGANPHQWQAQWAFLESLNATRQKGWVLALLAHPALLEECTSQGADNLYSRCRIGAPDQALQLVGEWAQLHGDETVKLAVNFYQANRDVYRRLAQEMVWQYREHLDRLEQDYLALPDGRCSLPVAYTLSYGYWMQKRITEWIDKLDARLADEQLTGDRRVNWLLARAQAEEIRHSPPQRHWWTVDRFLAGRGWLEEATLVAQSETVRLRAFQELAARQTVEQRIAAANKVLDEAARRCGSAESVAALAQWRQELDGLSQAFQERREHEETLIREAYAQRLRHALPAGVGPRRFAGRSAIPGSAGRGRR